MNVYKYDDLFVGMTEIFISQVTEEMMKAFLSITGDINPFHNDATYAKKVGYENRVVYGMLTASLLSTLAGVYLPGKYSLIQLVEIKFVKPVFVGDVLSIKGTVNELNDTVKQITLNVTITNQKQEKVLRGKMKIGVLNEG
jgi:Acyl dehydratase